MLQFAIIYSQSPAGPRDEEKILSEIYDSINAHDNFLSTDTPPEQNMQFLPLSAEVSSMIFQMKFYYDTMISRYYQREQYLAQSMALSKIIDNTLEKSSNIKLKINNVMFYDEANTGKQVLDDVKTYYHAELIKASFDAKDNVTLLNSINEWISKNTKNRAQKIDSLVTSGKTYILVSVTSYTGCWDKPKTSSNFIKKLSFNSPKQVLTVPTFNSKESVGYYNNTEKKYEAIKLPYKNGEFAMAIVLPYPGESLESITKFEEAEYRQLFQNLDEHSANIDYVIPTLNLPSISINESGTSVNGDDSIVCDSSASVQQATNANIIDFKPFYVNRPYGMFIYDVKTKFVVVQSLIRNPTSALSTLTMMRSPRAPFYLQSSHLFEVFHTLKE